MQGNPTPTPQSIGLITGATGLSLLAAANAITAGQLVQDAGNWPITITGSDTPGTATYSVQIGTFCRTGDFCFIGGTALWSGGTGSGSLRVSGLPFSSASDGAICSVAGMVSNLTLSTNNLAIFSIYPNFPLVFLDQYPVGGGASSPVPYSASGFVSFGMGYLL